MQFNKIQTLERAFGEDRMLSAPRPRSAGVLGETEWLGGEGGVDVLGSGVEPC